MRSQNYEEICPTTPFYTEKTIKKRSKNTDSDDGLFNGGSNRFGKKDTSNDEDFSNLTLRFDYLLDDIARQVLANNPKSDRIELGQGTWANTNEMILIEEDGSTYTLKKNGSKYVVGRKIKDATKKTNKKNTMMNRRKQRKKNQFL
eukprot:UN26536